MYNWRRMSEELKKEVIELRKSLQHPWHGPPHYTEKFFYHISAACYEHQPIIGERAKRMFEFEKELLHALRKNSEDVSAWSVLPNHYHVLVKTSSISLTTKALGNLHGRMSYQWNGDDNRRGRKCFHRCSDRKIRSERHKWATLNYIHHNPVHHGYVNRWQDWPFSSANSYLKALGYEEASMRWKDYPIMDYGKDWDDPDL